MKGHPVFIAQHTIANCYKEYLKKWNGISKNTELTKRQQEYIVKTIMIWIKLNI